MIRDGCTLVRSPAVSPSIDGCVGPANAGTSPGSSAAFRGQTPDEMYFGTGKHVPDELAAAKKAARQARLEESQARLEENRSVRCNMCE